MNKLEFSKFGKEHAGKRFFLSEATKKLMLNALDQNFIDECICQDIHYMTGIINQKLSDLHLTYDEHHNITESIKKDILF